MKQFFTKESVMQSEDKSIEDFKEIWMKDFRLIFDGLGETKIEMSSKEFLEEKS